MSIKQAIYTENNEFMTVEQVAQHEDHLKVKLSLQCVTKGCTARISYVPGNGNKSDFFRAVRAKDHSPECRKEREEEELKEKIEYRNTVEGSLDAKGIQQRIKYFFKKLNKPAEKKGSNKIKSRDKSNRPKVTTDKTKKKIGTTVVLGNPDAPSVEDIKKRGGKTSIRLSAKQLNQLAPSDVGDYLQLSAPIKKVTETKNGFEVLVFQGKKEATLVINEAFIRGTRDIQVKEYLRSLAKFVDTEKDNYEVSVYSFCVVEVCEENKIILSVSSFEEFFLSVSGQYNKPIKLDSYQAFFVSGLWK